MGTWTLWVLSPLAHQNISLTSSLQWGSICLRRPNAAYPATKIEHTLNGCLTRDPSAQIRKQAGGIHPKAPGPSNPKPKPWSCPQILKSRNFDPEGQIRRSYGITPHNPEWIWSSSSECGPLALSLNPLGYEASEAKLQAIAPGSSFDVAVTLIPKVGYFEPKLRMGPFFRGFWQLFHVRLESA